MAPNKRPDIQGLRCLAITCVLLFHLWPEWFSNGYLGVDMFFVISGFLIAKILSRRPKSKQHFDDASVGESRLSWSAIGQFYARRVHRIVPIYLIMLMAVLILAPAILMDIDVDALRVDALWSLAFGANLQGIFREESYFAQLSSPRFLLHTWSLAVEMQFYLFAPAIIWTVLQLSESRLMKYSYLGVMITASRVMQIFAPTEAAFGLVPCRMWEFLAGSLVYYAGEEGWDEAKKCCVKAAILKFNALFPTWLQSSAAMTVVAATLFFPSDYLKLPLTQLYQTMAVVVAGFMLLRRDDGCGNWLLNSRLAVEIGDASYAWYLVHWPVIQAVKYYCSVVQFSLAVGAVLFFSTLLLGLFIHYVVDATIQKLPQRRQLILFVSLLYAICLGSVVSPALAIHPPRPNLALKVFGWEPISARDYGNRFVRTLDEGGLALGNMTLAERIVINQQMENASVEYIDGESGSLIHKERGLTIEQLAEVERTGSWNFRVTHRGRGNLSLLLVGNSHAEQIAKELRGEWFGHYATFNTFTIGICLPLEIDYGWPRLKGELCQAYARAVLKLVETMKPDLLFINFFWDIMGHSPPLHHPIDGDRIYASLQAGIDSLHPNVRRRIYIGAPNLHFQHLVSHEFAKRLWLGSSLDSVDIKLKDHLLAISPNLARLEHLRCGKCIYVDWAEAFCDMPATGNTTTTGMSANTAVCHAFDPVSELAYFTDAHHYSYLGCWKIRPILRELLATVGQ